MHRCGFLPQMHRWFLSVHLWQLLSVHLWLHHYLCICGNCYLCICGNVSAPPTPSFQISSLLINCGRGSLKSLAGVDWMLSITYFNHNCGRCCFSCRCRKSCRTWLCRGRVLFAVKGEPLWSRRVARRTRRKERSLRPFG